MATAIEDLPVEVAQGDLATPLHGTYPDLASTDRGSATIGDTRYRKLSDPARTVGVILEHA